MSVIEKYIAYRFLRLVATPFNQWEAFKLGLINESGKKIRNANTGSEKAHFSDFNNIARNLKILLEKYAGIKNKFSAILVGSALLKESAEFNQTPEIVEEIQISLIQSYLDMTKTKEISEEFSTELVFPGKYVVESEFYPNTPIIYVNETVYSQDGVFEHADLLGDKVFFSKHQLRNLEHGS